MERRALDDHRVDSRGEPNGNGSILAFRWKGESTGCGCRLCRCFAIIVFAPIFALENNRGGSIIFGFDAIERNAWVTQGAVQTVTYEPRTDGSNQEVCRTFFAYHKAAYQCRALA